MMDFVAHMLNVKKAYINRRRSVKCVSCSTSPSSSNTKVIGPFGLGHLGSVSMAFDFAQGGV